MNYRELFAKRLKQLIEKKEKETGIRQTQTYLGRKFGCAQSMVAQMVLAEKMPSTELACAIADYFNCSLDYLLLGRDDIDIYKAIDRMDVGHDFKSNLKALVHTIAEQAPAQNH